MSNMIHKPLAPLSKWVHILWSSIFRVRGPMTPPGKRVQTINAPGSEMGLGTTATWGKAITDEVDATGFKWEWNGRSSKHIPFDWKWSLTALHTIKYQ